MVRLYVRVDPAATNDEVESLVRALTNDPVVDAVGTRKPEPERILRSAGLERGEAFPCDPDDVLATEEVTPTSHASRSMLRVWWLEEEP